MADWAYYEFAFSERVLSCDALYMFQLYYPLEACVYFGVVECFKYVM